VPVRQRVEDKRLLKLHPGIPECWGDGDGQGQPQREVTPQEVRFPPLLSNRRLDNSTRLERRGHRFVSNAETVYLCSRERAGQR